MLPTRPHAIVVAGVAGSRKTSLALALAQHYDHAFLDADDFHSEDAKARMAAGLPLTDELREPWVDDLAHALQSQARQGRSVVLAYSGLRAAHRQRLRDSGVPMRLVFLHADPSIIADRLARRTGHFMPAQLLDSQLDALQLPYPEPDVIVIDANGPRMQVLEHTVAAPENL